MFLFLVSFISGLLLAVRLMFFGAQRRRTHDSDPMPLRRSEPPVVAFLLMFGIAGYLLTGSGRLSVGWGYLSALLLGVVWAGIVMRIAVATARIHPNYHANDPSFLLQGRTGVVAVAIPAGGEGVIRYSEARTESTMRARDIAGGSIGEGVEICIERIDGDVAYVERWSVVERRL